MINIKNMSKKTKIIAGVVAFGVVGSFFVDSDETTKPEPIEAPVVEVKAEAVEPVIEEVSALDKYDYEIYKTFIENDPSAYEGRAVYEISIFGEFDLESDTIRDDIEEIIYAEAEIGLEEKPESYMVRVSAQQGTKEDYEGLPIASRTYLIIDDELNIKYSGIKHQFPLLDYGMNDK